MNVVKALSKIKCSIGLHDRDILMVTPFGPSNWHTWQVDWICKSCTECGWYTIKNKREAEILKKRVIVNE